MWATNFLLLNYTLLHNGLPRKLEDSYSVCRQLHACMFRFQHPAFSAVPALSFSESWGTARAFVLEGFLLCQLGKLSQIFPSDRCVLCSDIVVLLFYAGGHGH